MIDIDGSFGEGGGQILRTALALAAALGKDVRIYNIRAGRSEPGLGAQHLTSVRAIGEICSASVIGLQIGSTELEFKPGKPRSGSFRFEVGTAGSVTLVLQTVMPALPFVPGAAELEVAGGTDVRWSPPVDYVRLVTLPMLARMGFRGGLRLIRRGHYPRGGGIVRFVAAPSKSLQPFIGKTIGSSPKILGISHAVGLPRHVAERQASSADRVLAAKGLPRSQIELDVSQDGEYTSRGSGIVLSANTSTGAILGADGLGERGTTAETVGEHAAHKMVEELQSRTFLDRHMGDMIVPYLVLADGTSEVSVSRVTQHTLTNVKVAEWVAGVRFDHVGEIGHSGRLHVKGIGLGSQEVSALSRE